MSGGRARPAGAEALAAITDRDHRALRDLRGADLRGADLRGVQLRFADLTGARLTGADLTGARFDHVVLSSADMTGVLAVSAEFRFVEAVAARLTSVDGRNFRWRQADLRAADLSDSDLSGGDFAGCVLDGARLVGVDLTGGAVVDSTCADVDLSGARLSRLETVGSTFQRSALTLAEDFWCSRELVVEALRRALGRCDVRGHELLGLVVLSGHWCYAELREHLQTVDGGVYFSMALEILAAYPQSGAEQALREGRDWRAPRP